jgi:O-methyltransferase
MHKKIDEIAKFAYSHKETVLHTYNTAKQLIKDGVQGYFVECGVGAGAQLAAMMLAQKDTGAEFMVWGFDSFQGIPLAGPHDAEQPGIGEIKHDVNVSERERLVSSGITVHSKENVLYNIKKIGVDIRWLCLVEGWFQDTLHLYRPSNGFSKISLLRLDGDLYESTICCLENLYPLVVEGGVVVVDDWGLPGARKAVEDYFGDKLPEMKIVEGSGTVAYFVK